MSRARKIMGIECPIIREGDNLVDIVVDSYTLSDNAILLNTNVSGSPDEHKLGTVGEYVNTPSLSNSISSTKL